MIIRNTRRKDKTPSWDDTLISDDTSFDGRLSFRALGLLVNILGHTDDWVFNENEFIDLRKEGAWAVREALKELKKFGYIQKKAIRKDGKIVRWETTIYEVPPEEFVPAQ